MFKDHFTVAKLQPGMIHNETAIFTQNSIEEYIFHNFFPLAPKNIFLKNSLTGAVS